jgi:hypothetical protein
MKKPRSVVLGLGGFLTVAALVFWACSTTTTPVDQLTDCEKHQTGTLSVTNSSTLGLDYEIILDGTSQGKLAAGATAEYTVGAGPHNVVRSPSARKPASRAPAEDDPGAVPGCGGTRPAGYWLTTTVFVRLALMGPSENAAVRSKVRL